MDQSFQDPVIPSPASPALERFLESMKIDYYKWHDGIGYDLEALKEMTPAELEYVEAIMIRAKDRDWREVETLAALNTSGAIQALRQCLHSYNFDCRLFAVRLLKEMGVEDRVEEVVLDTLEHTHIGGGMTFALDLIEKYPTERLKQKLVWCSLNGNEDIRFHCASLALYLYGKDCTLYGTRFPFLFDLKETDFTDRFKAFRELCQMLGVDPEDYLTRR